MKSPSPDLDFQPFVRSADFTAAPFHYGLLEGNWGTVVIESFSTPLAEMTHPDNVAVGLLGLAMFAVGGLPVIILTLIAGLHSYRFLPLRRSRILFWIGMVVLVPVIMVTIPSVPNAVKDLAVIASFGQDAYADGLRVVHKNGRLSDGRFLSVFWAAAIGASTVVTQMLIVSPVAVWCLHFNRRRKDGLQLSGVVRLDGRPLPWARVTFFLVAGSKRRGYIAVKTDAAGRYEFHDVPLKRFRVTVKGVEGIPPDYRDPAQTSLEFIGKRLGPITYDLDLSR